MIQLLFPLDGVNLTWYRYRQLRGDLIALSRVVHTVQTDRDLIGQTEFYNQVVLDVRVWEAERKSFERGLQPGVSVRLQSPVEPPCTGGSAICA